MADPLSLGPVLWAAARSGGKWLLLLGSAGLVFVAWGRSRSIGAHAAYGSALLTPFFIAACIGMFATAKLRPPGRAKWFDADGKTLMMAVLVWSLSCLAMMVAVDWAASKLGVLGRAPNDLIDSVGMVLVTSVVLSLAAAWPGQQRASGSVK
ncbi:MAG: hypothetical protein JF607_12140 [Burkholderiales bacterium]|jgi:hypothetical protein|nr:hypothetical protein [Burkholderiales bacterium]MBW8894486.1 hypothetical protein [Burkholderiales bacterium]